ncbi:MAG: adenosylhomocysteinase [Thaumarchaeota archaeon]|nr:adenosylhomocysteinase [Nitrososphaerota archaeon]
MVTENYDIKDPTLVSSGKQRIEWASREMPVLALIKERFATEKPFEAIRISACLHITTETANLALTLKEGGADAILCASNPLSTQDDVAAALVAYGIPTNAIKGEDEVTYYKHINTVLDYKPQLTVDDGADLVSILHSKRSELIKNVIGGTEETTTGVIRLRSLERDGKLRYPIIAVNDAQTKYLFDNRYGTGQSTIDGITRATNILWAGKKVVVCGYGWCGHGIALRARGLGSQVIITEVEPVRALEAMMDGLQVMPLLEAAREGDIFITISGDKHVITKSHLEVMKDGAILANSGHFNVEIDIPALESMAQAKRRLRSFIDDYTLQDGRHLYLLGEGRLINLAAAEGHPASVMDMSFANQALCLEYMAKNRESLKAKVYPVPQEIDKRVAELKLSSMGIEIDTLTAEQKKYLSSWQEGT